MLINDNDPLATLVAWRDEAARAGEKEPDAMALATATPAGRPSVRMVLWRGLRDGELWFFTCYESRKAGELDRNPYGALCFYYPLLGRQVRIEGPVRRLPDEDSDAYFARRPVGHQLSAIVSPQSRPITSLDELRRKKEELRQQMGGAALPRPKTWGGYALRADSVELWIQGEERLHDRLLYTRKGSGWHMQRLAP
ncbi:MAG: pyridoxamine 5'-phosphate oxidase [Myxococcales bacterium]|nr:pyridoxamine 5'-phosphate oxidase [Myxococcota bacterium]MDW8283810.1 pyridoxamine 5'-phosphate oxidase [Myxococcales bacterium]